MTRTSGSTTAIPTIPATIVAMAVTASTIEAAQAAEPDSTKVPDCIGPWRSRTSMGARR